MVFQRKTRSVIDRRLKELEREMANINSEVKAISRLVPLGASKGLRLKREKPFETAGGEDAPGRRTDFQGNESIASADGDLGEGVSELGMEVGGKTAMQGAAENAQSSSLQTGERFLETRGGREKFVSYFAAGHFEHLRPVREETRVLRNKAIMMVIVVILAAIGLVRFLMR